MAAAIASRVTLAGAALGREQAPGKVASGSLSVGSMRARAVQVEACQSLSSSARFGADCSGLRDGGVRRGGRRVVVGRVFASSAVEDKVSQEEVPRSEKESSGETSQVAGDEGVRKDSDATAGSSSEFGDMEDIEVEKGFKMSRVCDRLIDVFLVERTKPEDWRILITFSQEWGTIRPYFFKRCESQAKLAEDPKKKADLLKLARQMKEVDDDMKRHNKLLEKVKESPLELDAIVARHRDEFTGDFFQHLHILTEACKDDLEKREEIATIASKCLIAVETHDSVSEDDRYLDVAQMKFDDILSAPSLEAAAAKIDNLAKTKQLDSTLMLLMTRAWASAKESTLMKDEAKDIMFYLYNVARANMAKSIPKEIQILRRLLNIEDPRERFEEMTNVFSPGDELEGKEPDGLYTKPEKLLKWINVVLDAFYSNKKGTLIKEAQNMLNPAVISRLEILRDVLEGQFM
ncbi:hypothetical protein M758_1G053100 [Ceratodon purpureus]|nr:hypothetical protein M758_1G053100 [Ceratodon purpureus]